jgi:hypothetical protein
MGTLGLRFKILPLQYLGAEKSRLRLLETKLKERREEFTDHNAEKKR